MGNKHRLIRNPTSQDGSFGAVAAFNKRDLVCPEARIYLFSGAHWGPNKGFGATHILAEHQKEMARAGFTISENTTGDEAVAAYVAEIVRERTPLYFEGGDFRRLRVRAARKAGTAILEFRNHVREPIWSVVTAYPETRKHGTHIGAVLA